MNPELDFMTKKKRFYMNLLFLFIIIIAAAIFLPGCAQSLFYYPDQEDYGYSPEKQNLVYDIQG